MKELSLAQIRQVEYELLQYFSAFCRENQIRFFLSNGTLLGAVKYQGFIPWDDDIDVLVPRPDYDRLIAIFQDRGPFRLFSHERDPKFRFPFAKLCDMRTVKIEANVDNGVQLGVDMDIFPLDAWAEDRKKADREACCMERLVFLLELSKMQKAASVNPVKKCLKSGAMRICRRIGSEHYVRKIQKATGQKCGKTYLGCKVWPIYGKKEIIPAQVFASMVEVDFQGGKFPAPVGYDVYLRCLYGDYQQDPPLEKQKTHHHFTAFESSIFQERMIEKKI